jgi:5,6-dimethylbenzimidazole synthase
MSTPSSAEPVPDSPVPCGLWSEQFRRDLHNLFVWRRDERHFRSEPLPDGVIKELVETACLAPSVGNAQPWRFVEVDCAKRRTKISEIFERENESAARIYAGEQEKSYAALKLEGLREAPVHLAVFCDDATATGHGLGRQTMPEMLRYSVVCAVHSLWLAAHARGFGVGWVSILDPDDVRRTLDVPDQWSLIAYLCIGWPKEHHRVPELERRGWQDRLAADLFFFTR